ncbi:hypothetical protein P4282_24105 [Bacillus swezeyi]|nr:hypothetical protein [Bacillus swezeyi]
MKKGKIIITAAILGLLLVSGFSSNGKAEFGATYKVAENGALG